MKINRLNYMNKKIIVSILAALLVISPVSSYAKDNVIRPNGKPRLQDDFYTNTNYDYLINKKLPAGMSSIDQIGSVSMKAEQQVKDIVNNIVSDKEYYKLKVGSDEWKMATFYRMALDMKKRNSLGIKPIEGLIEKIKKSENIDDISRFMIDNFDKDYAPFVNMGVAQDKKDSTMNILYVSGMNPGIDKNYLKNKDEYSLKMKSAYEKLIKSELRLAGNSEESANEKTKLIMGFETFLANIHPEEKAVSDLNNTYNVIGLDKLKTITQKIPYLEVMNKFKLSKANKIVADDINVIKKISSYYGDSKNFNTIKAYLEFYIINANAPYLTSDYLNTLVNYSYDRFGVKPNATDKELAYQLTSSKFGNLLGKLYVQKYFNENTKQQVTKMIKEILGYYKKEIRYSWLSSKTKKSAYKKIDNLKIKVGYPNKWESYKNIIVKPYNEGGNIIEAIESFNRDTLYDNMERLNKSTDKTEWVMTPQTVNAYYNPGNNEVVFTAAILQPPFYSTKNNEATNLGAIGAIIGHEISHAFDSTGAQFDHNGNLHNWWSKSDYKKFQNKVRKASATFSKLEVLPGYRINGEISTGEILADLGGLNIALQIAKKKNLDTKQVFRSFSRIWAGIGTKEAAIEGLTDEHPYNKYRVNYIVNMFKEFYRDFKIKKGDKMYVDPKQRLSLWR